MTYQFDESTYYDLVIVGFGMASHRLLQELTQHSQSRLRILVLGEEPHPAYNRVLLPQFVEDCTTDLSLAAVDFTRHDLSFHTGDAVCVINRREHQVQTVTGRQFYYRQLVLATGSAPVFPDFYHAATLKSPTVCGKILALRNVQDAIKLRAISQGSHIVIQGGGFIALETAAALSTHYRVTVCHRGAYLMNRQLDQTAAELLQKALIARGITLLLRSEINGAMDSADKLELAITGPAGVSTLATDLLIAALGVKPRVELAEATGLAVNRGIVVNSQLQTSDQEIFAIGECAECHGETVGLVAPAYQQAKVLAHVLSGQRHIHYQSRSTATMLKISGLAISSIGDVARLQQKSELEVKTMVYQDFQQGDYRRIWLRDGQLLGAVLCGDTSLSPYYQRLISQSATADTSEVETTLVADDMFNDLLFYAA